VAVNLGLARLVIVVGLVLVGVVVLANGFSDEETQAAPSPSASPTPSNSPSPSPRPNDGVVGQKQNVLVQVFNGTNAAGFAADFQAQLEADGYLPAGSPADAPTKPIVDSIVYFKPDDASAQNKADARLLAQEYLDGAPVERLPEEFEAIVNDAADVIVVLGEDVAPAT
jgi:hypothetical protein